MCKKNKYGGLNYNENETKKITKQASKKLLNDGIVKDLFDTFSQHGWQGTYDFKAHGNVKISINGNITPVDYYTVNGKLIRADQFGNYLAGYATTMGFGPAGTVSTFVAGVVDGWRGGGTEFAWFDDSGSREMIWQGAKDAYKNVWNKTITN